jgi:dynamin-binding protein
LDDLGESLQSPEDQKRIKKKFNLIRELVDTEDSFATDMGVTLDIYARLLQSERYFGYVCKSDVTILFGKVEKIRLLSRQFTRALKSVIPPYIFETRGLSSDKQLLDVTTRVGAIFLDFIPLFEEPYKEYCDDNKLQMETFYRIRALACPLIDLWMSQALEDSETITKAWTLDALLIKPVQRLLKYPLLLTSMLGVTPETHGDYENLKQAALEMEACADRINSDHMIPGTPSTGTSSKRSLDEDAARMRGLATDHTADRALQELLQEFYDKAKKVRSLIHAVKVNSKEIQSHFDSNGQLAKAWLSWVMALGVDDDDPLKLKRYKHYTLFSSPFTSTSSTLLSSSKLSLKIDQEVISILHQVFTMYERTELLISDRQRYHTTYMKYVQSKSESNGQSGNSNSSQQHLEPPPGEVHKADLFVKYHNSLKDGLPDLFELTREMIELCMEKYVSIQRQWFRMAVDAMATVFNIRVDEIRNPDGSDPIAEKFRRSISPASTIIGQLGICNQESFEESGNSELQRWDSDEMMEISEDSASIFSQERKVSEENKTISSIIEENYDNYTTNGSGGNVPPKQLSQVSPPATDDKKLRRKSSILTLTNWPNKTIRRKASKLDSAHE